MTRCIAAVVAALACAFAVADEEAPFAAFSSQDRLLVVSPHPDDESLCCAGVMQ